MAVVLGGESATLTGRRQCGTDFFQSSTLSFSYCGLCRLHCKCLQCACLRMTVGVADLPPHRAVEVPRVDAVPAVCESQNQAKCNSRSETTATGFDGVLGLHPCVVVAIRRVFQASRQFTVAFASRHRAMPLEWPHLMQIAVQCRGDESREALRRITRRPRVRSSPPFAPNCRACVL